MKFRLLPVLVLCAVLTVPAAGQDGGSTQVITLTPGATVSSAVDISADGSAFTTFSFEVPDDAFGVKIRITGAEADLDLFLKQGEEIRSYEYVDANSSSEDFNETLFITRLSDPPLENGRYYVDVVFQRVTAPFDNWKRLREVPFDITMELVRGEAERRIRPGRNYKGTLDPENGMASIYEVELDEPVSSCRLDIFDTTADIDLLVGYGSPVMTRENAGYVRESLLGNESIVVREDDGLTLEPGTYYITVFDQVSKEHAEHFTLRFSMDSEVPDEITAVPPFPRTDDELKNALYSTVEVIGKAGKGSGCIVSSDGLVLTNWHVVRDFAGDPSEPVYIAVNFSLYEPPRELFRAEVVDYDADRDFALLRIESGLYGQSLPYNYRFPYFELGDPEELSIGQPLSFLGYPGIGGTGSRASVSLTRGIVSGFERSEDRSLIKTDAVIHGGNSGGAAINAYYELLGLPTVVVGREGNTLSFINPVSDIPAEWKRRYDLSVD
jgi:S1-C subfamily serine protease